MIVAVPMPAPIQSVTERGVEIAPLQFVEHGAEDHRAGRAERMTHRDGAAVHVDLCRIDLERLHVAQHDGGKRLVQLEQVDVRNLHLRFGQQLLGHVDRPGRA